MSADLPRRECHGPTKGGGPVATIVWNAPQDHSTLDARTCVLLQIGEAKMAERICYAACRKDPTNRPLMTAWRHAKDNLRIVEALAMATCGVSL